MILTTTSIVALIGKTIVAQGFIWLRFVSRDVILSSVNWQETHSPVAALQISLISFFLLLVESSTMRSSPRFIISTHK